MVSCQENCNVKDLQVTCNMIYGLLASWAELNGSEWLNSWQYAKEGDVPPS